MKKAILLAGLILAGTFLGAQGITVTSPNGDEEWTAGIKHDITWTTTGITAGNFRVFLFDGDINLGTIAMNIPVSQHSFTWTVGHLIDAPDAGPGADYRIKIRVMSEAPNDFSDRPFVITEDTSPDLHPAEGVHTFPSRPPFTRADQPNLQFRAPPKLQVRDLTYDYRNKRFQAWVKNANNTRFVGHFRWEWHTCCGGRTANKDIPPSQSEMLQSPNGMPFHFECDPPYHECTMEAHFSIHPRTLEGTNLPASELSRDLPRYEHTQFLMSEQRVLLRFLHGSTYVNRNQGYTITANDANDSDPENRTATFRVGIGIRNCGGDAGTHDHLSGRSLYWSVHHWPSNTYALQPNRFIAAGQISSPIAPGQGMLVERPLTLPIRSGRYELRIHMGSNWRQGQICAVYIRFADELTH